MAVVYDQQVSTRVSMVFYVKENEDSPYQGFLTFDPKEFANLNDKTLNAMQLDQFEAWKIVRDTPPPKPSPDDKVRIIADLQQQKVMIDQQIAELAADSAVAVSADALIADPVK